MKNIFSNTYTEAISKNIFIYIVLFLPTFISSCVNNNYRNQQLLQNLEFIEIPDSTQAKTNFNELIFELSTLNNFESDYIGMEGRKSTQKNYSLLLSKMASEQKLIDLTKHSSPYVRISAFDALKIINSLELKSIFIKHIDDKETVNYHSGCMIQPHPVNISFYETVKSGLSKLEDNNYKHKLLDMYKENGLYRMLIDYKLAFK